MGFTSFPASSAEPDTEEIIAAPNAPFVTAVSERAATSKRFLNFTIHHSSRLNYFLNVLFRTISSFVAVPVFLNAA